MMPLEAAREYCRRGWRVIPVPVGEKGPRISGWQTLVLSFDDLPQHFDRACNVGVRLGTASDDLVDIDLDCGEALQLADIYLPKTKAEFGRASKPRSHRLYVASGAGYEAFNDPASSAGKDMLLELRAGEGHQTLFPPSIADGEQRVWHGDIIAPRVVAAASLRSAVAWLAIGCLAMRHVSEHAAHRPGPDLPRLLWEADHDLGRRVYGWLGQPPPDAPQQHPRPRNELTRAELDLAELAHAIPNDCSWDEWNRLGMAIWAASGGSAEGSIVFDDFSAKSPKYDPHNTAARWRNYARSPPSRITAGTLIHLARQHGWKGRAR
jgi:hypothetical protein